ncbi:MAG: helix-turn-helix transcriptional regulator [Cyclobacteriaceae bacterium]
MTIGSTIKEIRLKRNLSQVELSKLTGLAQNVISRIERDVHFPSDKNMGLIAKALNVDKDVFHYLSMLESIQSNDKLKSRNATKMALSIDAELREIYDL